MNTLYLIASVLFFITAIASILYWVSLWQRKEYRLDRFLVHIKETNEGKQLFLSKVFLLKLLAILLYPVTFLYTFSNIFYQIFVTFIFAWDFYYVLKESITQTLRRPIITFKAAYLILLPLVVIAILYFFPVVNERFFWLLLLDRIIVINVAFFVLTLWLPTEFHRDVQIENAIKKISHFKKLIVIGVTGSYGKSSTKEYIAQVLEKRFKVVKTKGTNNTPIGIAQTIVRYLQKDTEVFVVEMGAYKKGEIAELCRIVSPRIGVLTGISNQHVSLFGAVENTKKTKYELIESLPNNGLALFNGNNKDSFLLYKKTHRRKLLYKIENGNRNTQDEIVAFNPQVSKGHILFDVSLAGKLVRFWAPLIGAHSIENVLPAIAIGFALGMKPADIQDAVSKLIPPPKTMRLSKLPNGVYILDNTFSVNPQAAQAILDYLSLYKKKKILVLSPLIELGKEGEDEHLSIGKSVSKLCQYLLLTNNNFEQALRDGIEEENGKCKIIKGSSKDMADFVLENTGRDDIIAFVGRESGKVLKEVL